MTDAPRHDKQNRQLCAANRTNGEPCNAPAMRGQTVCRVHGGSAPQARRKARLRLDALAYPAIATLAKELTEATESRDRQSAANSILDRSGYSRTHTISTDDAREILLERLLQAHEDGLIDDEGQELPEA